MKINVWKLRGMAVVNWRPALGFIVLALGMNGQLAAVGDGNTVDKLPNDSVILGRGTYWRMFLTQRKPVIRNGNELKEINCKKSWADSWTIGISTPLPSEKWTGVDFDDAEWSRYRLPFFTINEKHKDPGKMPVNALLCLRGRFTVVDPKSVKELALSLEYRGGVIAYLNGKEIARGHLTDNDKKGLEAFADEYTTDTYETTDGKPLEEKHRKDPANAERLDKRIRRLTDIKIPAALLKQGENVLALEIHRAPLPENAVKKTVFGTEFTWVPIGLDGIELKVVGSGIVANAGRPAGAHVWAHPPDQRLYLSNADYGSANDPGLGVVKINGARNGAFPGQIMVSSPMAIKGLKVEVSELKCVQGVIPAKAVEVRYPVADNDGGGMRNFDHSYEKTFDTLNTNAPQVVAAAKGAEGAVQPIWLTVNVPENAKPGDYKGIVTVTVEDAAPMKMPFEIVVADWTLPGPRDFQTEIGVMQSPETVAMKYKVDLWSEQHWKLMDQVFRCMGLVGADHVYILLQSRLHFGNSQSMVRWVKKDGGGYTHDFSIVERYLDMATNHLGKIPVVSLVAWEQSDGWYGYASEKPGEAQHGVRFTIVDPKTGKLEEGEGPKFGTPEAREFWKPVYDGMTRILKARGLEKSMMHGVFGDRIPNKECIEDLRILTPGVRWVSQNHPGPRPEVFGMKPDEYLGAGAFVYIGLYVNDPQNPKFTRKYGWQAKYRTSQFPRDLSNNTTPSMWHTIVERNLIKGYLGIARAGFDFWDVLPNRTGGDFGGYHICNRYPENHWAQTSITVASRYWVSPGVDGPLSTMRLELMRAGLQECEARIFMEKALVDPEKRAKVGEDLAKRCQEILDERQSQLTVAHDSSFWQYNGWRWEASTGELFKLAAELAKKLGN